MAIMYNIGAKIKKRPKKILFPEGNDSRIKQAAKILEKKKLVNPVLLKSGDVEERLKEGLKLLKKGSVDGVVSGCTHSTALTVKSALKIIGVKKGITRASSYFLMILKNRELIFADCAVNICPNDMMLAEIAITTAESAKLLGINPRVAMLSFSTKQSAKHDIADKVIHATELVKKLKKRIVIEGEIQADVALVKEIAKRKAPKSKIKGDANVLIFPDLNSGNIGYKLVERLAGAEAIGPILQGLNKPVNDLSRGSSVNEIVDVAIITALQASQK